MMLLRCYPKVTDFIFHFFNQAPAADYRFLPIFSYGFFVACGFFAASIVAVWEMKRREGLGLLRGQESEVVVGEAPTLIETALYFIIGFVVFFKLVGVVVYQPMLKVIDPHTLQYKFPIGNFLLSISYGSIWGGLIGGTLMALYFYYSKNKEKLPQPVKKKINVYPSDGIGDLVLIAAVLGILGAVLFNFLETPGDYSEFWKDPVGFLTSGLSVYGGLICAGLGFAAYALKKKLHFGHFFDSVAPAFMLANGIGRLGCQVSGDGDWGIVNPHPKPDWVPQFLWSDTYAHHIVSCDFSNNIDAPIPGCMEVNCCQLAQAVYPTPIYEFLMCTAVFLILWGLRKKLTYKPGMIFTLFMILIGIQRFAIEQWRDLGERALRTYFGIPLRQSEEISVVLALIGIAGSVYLWRKYSNTQTT